MPVWSRGVFGLVLLTSGLVAQAGETPVVFADQGPDWTPDVRAAYYAQDQGSRLIPLAWLAALHQPDGTSFLDGSLARYGYIPPISAKAVDLPVGFTVSAGVEGAVVGMTCAACHTRALNVAGRTYRIDGGPAFADFATFVTNLDAAMLRALASEEAFSSFAGAVLGRDAAPDAVRTLRVEAGVWSMRFHLLIEGSITKTKPWGPARIDAIGMIYNHLSGLDLGPPPTFVLPSNMAPADAPTRYPFLWNAWRQDRTQWGGFAANGNATLALARNLGQVYGVFATFHPTAPAASTHLDRDYLAANSANVPGIAMAEGLLTRLGAPVWPFALDRDLAARGKRVFERPIAQGGCVQCHGVRDGDPRPPTEHTWKTEDFDVGTDIHQWQVLLRSAKTGALAGARVPGVLEPLAANDLSLNILKAVVAGTLTQLQAAQGPHQAGSQTASRSEGAGSVIEGKTFVPGDLTPGSATTAAAAKAAGLGETFVYEARVLHGIWAAAPYLHNGSVSDLADLLKPAAARRKSFAVGPAYDVETVGLAAVQPKEAFVLDTTGCGDRASGNSNCGHEYGTSLPEEDKRALLEYLKAL